MQSLFILAFKHLTRSYTPNVIIIRYGAGDKHEQARNGRHRPGFLVSDWHHCGAVWRVCCEEDDNLIGQLSDLNVS